MLSHLTPAGVQPHCHCEHKPITMSAGRHANHSFLLPFVPLYLFFRTAAFLHLLSFKPFFPAEAEIKGPSVTATAGMSHWALTLQIMTLEASDVRVTSWNTELQRAAGRGHDGVEMKQGVLPMEEREISHQGSELTRGLQVPAERVFCSGRFYAKMLESDPKLKMIFSLSIG